MPKLSRRDFMSAMTACVTTLTIPNITYAVSARVVVIGGGAGGATAARHIAKDGKGAVSVTLIEPKRHYYTCFFSNLYIGGFRSLDSIGHNYGALAAEYSINIVHDLVVGIEGDTRTVTLAGGGIIPYDRLIIAPGIDFIENAVPGWDISAQNRMPHAYKAGSQTELLKAQLHAMRPGGVFVMVAPPNPYRCPPAPYERVSMIAHLFKRKNPTAKIIILDPKESFSKQELFLDGWAQYYPDMIEWVGGEFGIVERVRPKEMEIDLDGETIKADVCNLIPPMQAGKIAERAGFTNDAGWCPIIPTTLQSRVDKNVYVLGDAAQSDDMPKSAFSANSQAKICAMTILYTLMDAESFPARFSNICWSLIAPDDGIKVGANYEAGEENIIQTSGFISQANEDSEIRKKNYQESIDWYTSITNDMFGNKLG